MNDPVPVLVPQEIANDDTVRVAVLHVVNGEEVEAGARVAEIETSKSNVEISAPARGWVELCCRPGDDIAVGAVLARLHASKDAFEAAASADSPAIPDSSHEAAPVRTVFSPAALKHMGESGVDPSTFAGRAFIRTKDLVAPATPPPAEPGLPAPAFQEVPFVQTFCEDWPWHKLVKADLLRINGLDDWREFLLQWWWNPCFRYVLWFRIAQAARRHPLAKALVYPAALWLMNRCHFASGIRIPLTVRAGPGLLVAHWGGVWINPGCTLGANCSLGNDINLGGVPGTGGGVPQLGDNVFVGPGARMAGPLTIGQNAAVMANTLVTTSLPAGAIAIGVPHRVSGHQDVNRHVTNRCQYSEPSPSAPQ